MTHVIIPAQPGWIGLDDSDDGIWFSGTVIAWRIDPDCDFPAPVTEYGMADYIVSPEGVVVLVRAKRWLDIETFLNERACDPETAARLRRFASVIKAAKNN